MPAQLTWRPLPLGSRSDLPVLLAAMDKGSSDYTVYITDTANLWSEALDRKAICMRGWKENTSIDPSDTPENMATFLAKLQNCLQPVEHDQNGSTLHLSTGKGTEAGDDGLVLQVTCQIPGLAPLVWPIYLKKLKASGLATHLVFPLLEAHYARDREIDSLLEALHHKDAVMSKLLDKLEATGTSLDQIFNVLSGKRKISRKAAEDKVQGLAPFRKVEWAQGNKDRLEETAITVEELLGSVFSTGGFTWPELVDVGASPALDHWMESFKSVSHAVAGNSSGPSGSHKPTKASQEGKVDETNGDNYDDEFQVQTTPPRKKRRTAHQTSPDDASTADDSEEEVAKQPLKSSVGRSRIGAVGGRIQLKTNAPASPEVAYTPCEQARSPSRPLKTQTVVPVKDEDEDETASEADGSDADDNSGAHGQNNAARQASTSDADEPKMARTKTTGGTGKMGGARKIGQIGGKVPQQHAPSSQELKEDDEADDDHADGSTTSDPIPSRRIGAIGKIGGAAAKSAHTGATRGRAAASGKAAEEQHRETSQERVERKREEMRRELDKKASTGATKKKRRF